MRLTLFHYALFSDSTTLQIQISGGVPKSVSVKNPLKSVNFRCHCKFNVLFLIVL